MKRKNNYVETVVNNGKKTKQASNQTREDKDRELWIKSFMAADTV